MELKGTGLCSTLERSVEEMCYTLWRNVMGRFADTSGYSTEENELWEKLKENKNLEFKTARGLEFRYWIEGNEMFIDRKEKSITRSTVNMAFRKARELGTVTGPKKLGVFGASYLYPVFLELGICRKE